MCGYGGFREPWNLGFIGFPAYEAFVDATFPETLKSINLDPTPSLTLSVKIAQKPYIVGSLGPKALEYESFDAKGKGSRMALTFCGAYLHDSGLSKGSKY